MSRVGLHTLNECICVDPLTLPLSLYPMRVELRGGGYIVLLWGAVCCTHMCILWGWVSTLMYMYTVCASKEVLNLAKVQLLCCYISDT